MCNSPTTPETGATWQRDEAGSGNRHQPALCPRASVLHKGRRPCGCTGSPCSVDRVTRCRTRPMKLETSQDLLNRVRAKHGTSWYGLIKLMGVHKNTVYSWKGGHTALDRKFAPRVAELLDEPAEYVLACLEGEREQSAEVLKLWRRIAERFRSTASILLVALGLLSVPRGASATVLDVGSAEIVKPPVYTLCATRYRWGRRLAKLWGCLKSQCAAPLPPPWARICSMGLAASRSPA